MKAETIVLNNVRGVTLTAYVQEPVGKIWQIVTRPAVLVIPGGAYRFCSEREADPVALAFLAAGYQTFVLRYTVGADMVWPQPLEDYEQAMQLIRANAGRWMLYPNKIAVVGFSAGGHLAGCAATISKNRPNAAILGYALLTDDVKEYNRAAPDLCAAVDAATCPCFLFAARTDETVPVRNTLRFAAALEEHGVNFETHIYASGPHGFSTAQSAVQDPRTICPRTADWVGESIAWLKDVFGDFEGEAASVSCD